MNEIFNISGNIDSTKRADHIFEMPELAKFCDECLSIHVKVGLYERILKFKDDL